MIFPAAYLNSPSSMFGHTLLRIDQADVQSEQDLAAQLRDQLRRVYRRLRQQHSLRVERLDGRLSQGLFALVPYQEKLSEYRSLENRDLWEYRLNLTPEETAAHGRTCMGTQADSASVISSSTRTARIGCWSYCKSLVPACDLTPQFRTDRDSPPIPCVQSRSPVWLKRSTIARPESASC
jgi:hypothetical protein